MNKGKKGLIICMIILFGIAEIMLVSKTGMAKRKKVSIKLNYSTVVLYNKKGGKSIRLNETTKGGKGKVRWKSGNKKVASVNSAGKVIAKKVGTTIITAKYSGKKAKCKIIVRDFKKDYTNSIKKFDKFLVKGYDYITINNKRQKVVFKNWQLVDLGDGPIKELIVRAEIPNREAYWIIYEYYNGKIIDTGKRALLEGPSDDKPSVVRNWHRSSPKTMFGYESKQMFYDAKGKNFVFFGKQQVYFLYVDNGRSVSLGVYNMHPEKYERSFYDDDDKDSLILQWYYNTKNDRQEYLK